MTTPNDVSIAFNNLIEACAKKFIQNAGLKPTKNLLAKKKKKYYTEDGTIDKKKLYRDAFFFFIDNFDGLTTSIEPFAEKERWTCGSALILEMYVYSFTILKNLDKELEEFNKSLIEGKLLGII